MVGSVTLKSRPGTALGYFPGPSGPATISVVCPACGIAFPVPESVLRASPTLGCPACRHERPAPILPTALRR